MTPAAHIINACKSELRFTTSRSGGSGGQHVNKVETKVTLRWNIGNSLHLRELQKDKLLDQLSRFINQNKELVLYHQTERSQQMNKERVVKKWERLIHQAFYVQKLRKPTKPSKRARASRRKAKENRSAIKSLRQKPRLD